MEKQWLEKGNSIVCPVCAAAYFWRKREDYNYCPKCGVRLVESGAKGGITMIDIDGLTAALRCIAKDDSCKRNECCYYSYGPEHCMRKLAVGNAAAALEDLQTAINAAARGVPPAVWLKELKCEWSSGGDN